MDTFLVSRFVSVAEQVNVTSWVVITEVEGEIDGEEGYGTGIAMFLLS